MFFYTDSSNHIVRSSINGTASVIVRTNLFVGSLSFPPKYSWDEKYVYIRGQKVGDSYSNIYRVNIDGTGMTKIISKPADGDLLYIPAMMANKKFLVMEWNSTTGFSQYVIYSEDGTRGDVVFDQTASGIAFTGIVASLDGSSLFANKYSGVGSVTNTWKKYSIKDKTMTDVITVITNSTYTFSGVSPEADFLFRVEPTNATTYSFKKVSANGGALTEFTTITVTSGETASGTYSPYKALVYAVQNASQMKGYYMNVATVTSTYVATYNTADLSGPTAKYFMAFDCFGKMYLSSTTNIYSPGVFTSMLQ